MFKGLFDFKNQKIYLKYRIIIPVFIFIFCGLMMLYFQSDFNDENYIFFISQLQWLIIGSFLFIIMQFVRIQYFYDHSYTLYILLILILIVTYFFGVGGEHGGKSWITILGFRGQPSEFCKILYIIFLARFLSDINNKSKTNIYLPILLLTISMPFLLILMQKNLVTSLTYISIILPMMYYSGIKIRIIFLLISPVITMFATSDLRLFTMWILLFLLILLFLRPTIKIAIYNFILNITSGIIAPIIWLQILSKYQRDRILIFLGLESDPTGKEYQINQSLNAIGSGGFNGKDASIYGTQAEHNYLPISESDFLIASIAEKFGFVAIFIIIITLIYFVVWSIIYSQKIQNKFPSILLFGFCTMLFMHMVINMGMISSLLPVMGLPAPFISYGGSFFLSCSIMIGLINNIINNHI